MTQLRLMLAQINTAVGDVAGNADRVRAELAEAARLGADLVLFPELTLTGYPPEDLLFRSGFVTAVEAGLRELRPATRGLTAMLGTPHRAGTELTNALVVLHDGEEIGRFHKHLLPNYGVFDEARYFDEGREPVVFDRGPVRCALSICEDIWVEDGPGERACASADADLIVNISASPYHAGKSLTREKLFGDLARRTGRDLVVCNLVGGQDELVFDGQSLHLGPDGEVKHRAPSFTESRLVFDLEVEGRARSDVAEGIRRLAVPAAPASTPATAVSGPGVTSAVAARGSREAQIYRALTLAVHDYVTKNGFAKVVIGLSGGLDSALTAALAVDALGSDSVTGVGMPSAFSSSGSVTDSEELARRLGIVFRVMPIGETYECLLRALAPAFEGTPFGVAEENLQARVRGTLVMALSNKFGWIVLTTGNKSETAVGFSTLYGDTAGGFAPLKDVYKTDVYALCRYRNSVGGGEVIPSAILEKAPSAELRPDQRDTDSLPPYDVLDLILEAYVERDESINDIVARGPDRDTVRRVVRMVDRAEYKRRQSPPGVKITPRAFGRDRRLPIASRWRAE